MPKMKTKKSLKRRFKYTGKGKIKRTRACRGHLKSSKTTKRKRNLRRSALVSETEAHKIRRSLPRS